MKKLTLELSREDAENLYRLLDKMNYFRVGAAIVDDNHISEDDVQRVLQSVVRVYCDLDRAL